MAINFVFILLFSGILSFFAPKKHVAYLCHLLILGAFGYGIAALSDCFATPDLTVMWEAMPNFHVLLNIVPVAQTKVLALGLLIFGAVSVMYNITSAEEQSKSFLNGLVVFNIVLLLVALCSTNYFQLLAAIGMADVVVYSMLNSYEAKRQYIYGNFLADFLLLNIFAIILGQHDNIEIVDSGGYSTDWHHRDYIAIILLTCILIKSGMAFFHSAYQKMSPLSANRLNFILFMTTPLMGAVILNTLQDVLDISRYSLPIIRIFAILTILWGACGTFIMYNNHRKCSYMAMVFWGLYFCAFSWLSSINPLSFLMFLGMAYLFNTVLSNVGSSMQGKIPVITMLVAAIGYMLAWWNFSGTNIILAIAGEGVIFMLTAHVASTYKNSTIQSILPAISRLWLYITIISGTSAVFYLIPDILRLLPHIVVIAIFWCIVATHNPFAYRIEKFNTENIQTGDITTSIYETMLLAPLQITGRVLRLTIDIVFLERTVISSIKNAIRFLIYIFRRLHSNSVLSGIIFSLLGALIIAFAYYNGVVK